MEHVLQNWQIRKPAVISRSGLIACQNLTAARAGAVILKQGGNAVDAAVAAAFALTVTEPWMSGIGGGGYMVCHLADEQTTRVLDFNMISPKSLDVDRYSPISGADHDMFGWPRVKDDRNLKGYDSICVPGAVDGLGLALAEFGTISFAEVLKPAIELSETGLAIDWFATLAFAHSASDLAEFPTTVAAVMKDGLPPAVTLSREPRRLKIPNLEKTLKRLAMAGRRDFYEGQIAGDIVSDMADGGGVLSAQDMADYSARIIEPLVFDYHGARVHTVPGLSGGPTLFATMSELEKTLDNKKKLGGASFKAYAEALSRAYKIRLSEMGHSSMASSCTSHLNVVDSKGNMVALTNTLLARFGSKVVLPQTGLFMNNGMMWFDTMPGRSNSIAPGVRPLANMCPTVISRDETFSLAIGAAGGRQIVSSIAQLISFIVDFGMSLEEALHHPRLNMSGGDYVTCDKRFSDEWVSAVSESLPVERGEIAVFPVLFSVPSAVMRDTENGINMGQADPMMPLAGVAEA